MIINHPHLCTHLPIWDAKHNQKSLVGTYPPSERVALLHKRKVDFGTPVLIIEFEAKWLKGQRYAILKKDAMECVVGTNGSAPMYEVPLSKLEYWDSGEEVLNIIKGLWPEERIVS